MHSKCTLNYCILTITAGFISNNSPPNSHISAATGAIIMPTLQIKKLRHGEAT